jgi:hypothetical protein
MVMIDLSKKVTLLITSAFAIVFIGLGSGILLNIFLPGPQLAGGMRLIFGGVILLYGIIRAVGVIRKFRRQGQIESTLSVEERPRNQ